MSNMITPNPLRGLRCGKWIMSISDNVSMFYNAKPHIFEKAKMLRKNMTVAEKNCGSIWKVKIYWDYGFVHNTQLIFLLLIFIVILLDWLLKLTEEFTNQKTKWNMILAVKENWGIKVIRFTNEEIENNTCDVIKQYRADLPETQIGASSKSPTGDLGWNC